MTAAQRRDRSSARPWFAVAWAASAVALGACSLQPTAMPDSLYGTWEGGNTTVDTLRLSDGGRIDINDGTCAGSYHLSAMDTNIATLDTDYIRCGLMDGYILDAIVEVDGNALTIDGPVINGTYTRVD
ncbi:MAG: hypothetical protein ACFCVK_14700 [Acidimicrobiales bacterium]